MSASNTFHICRYRSDSDTLDNSIPNMNKPANYPSHLKPSKLDASGSCNSHLSGFKVQDYIDCISNLNPGETQCSAYLSGGGSAAGSTTQNVCVTTSTTSTSTTTTCPSSRQLTTKTCFSAQSWVNAHNYLRCLHGIPPVVWDSAMAASAQEWADYLEANSLGMKHCCQNGNAYDLAPPAGPAGENIADMWMDNAADVAF